MALVPVEAWNVAVAVVGPVGCGKSTVMRERMRALRRSPGCYTLVHDLTRKGGQGADVLTHASVADLRAGLQRAPGAVHRLAVYDGMEAVRAADDLSRVVCGGDPATVDAAPPILLVLDDAVTVADMSPSYIDPLLKRLYFYRRHRHLGFIWGTQRPANVHPLMWEGATEFVLFRVEHHATLRRLESEGLPSEILHALPHLGPHESRSWKRGA